ncbi:MAG: DNA polymerase Y family protein [Burkholderiaceae bacterium]
MHWIAMSNVPASESATEPADPRLALAWWALTYTPRVALLDEAVLMEVSTSERLWGGRTQLLELLFKRNRSQVLGSAAFAATSLEALGLLRLVLEGTARPASLPGGLPLSVLSAAQPHLPTLSRIGCRTWGDVRALPRAGVARRFGAGLLDALDTAWGQRPETHAWLRLPEQFDATFELPALTQAAPALLFGAQRLLHQLRVWLAGRQLGVLAFELHWLLEARRFIKAESLAADAREQHLVVRTALATQDVAHLLRLLSEQFARIRLPAPAQALRLRSLETAPLATPSRNLLPEDRSAPADAGSLQQLAERLTVRLGAGCVLHVMPQADHRPERMQRWQPMPHALVLLAKVQQQQQHRAGAIERRPDRNGHWLPTWLLRDPLPLAVQGDCPQFYGPLELLAGPDRLEAGWWVMEHGASVRSTSATNQPVAAPQPALRDYFIAHGTQAGLLWIYRERLGHVGAAADAGGAGGGWFLQGLYA